jgi:hypothetical protein
VNNKVEYFENVEDDIREQIKNEGGSVEDVAGKKPRQDLIGVYRLRWLD